MYPHCFLLEISVICIANKDFISNQTLDLSLSFFLILGPKIIKIKHLNVVV